MPPLPRRLPKSLKLSTSRLNNTFTTHFTQSLRPFSTTNKPLKVGFYFNGAEQYGTSEIVPSINPASDEVIAEVTTCTKQEVDQAVESSKEGFEIWGKQMTGEQRARVLFKAADLIEENAHDIAVLETRDTGHCISETKAAHVEQGVATLRYYAGLAGSALDGKHIPLDNGSYAISSRLPYGVTGAIVAWNYPFNMALYKSAILLAVGNSVVMKPSTKTPINTIGLASLFTKAGMPPGTFNVIQGDAEAGSHLCEHPDVHKVSFTGSIGVGQKILKMCATPNIKPVTLELGGKSPLIVFEDADIIPAVKAAIIANFYSAGEICTNGTRVFVHEKIYSQFLSEFKSMTEKLKMGCPEDPETQIGCLIDSDHADSVRDFITKGLQEGSTLITGGINPSDSPCFGSKGLASHLNPNVFIPPTIFSDVEDNTTLAKEEIFGPVASVLRFSDTDEVIKRANATPYGLASGLFTKDLIKANYVSQRLESGIVWVNTYNIYSPNVPVGGFKQSGFGREFGSEALDHVSHTKSTYFEMNPNGGGDGFLRVVKGLKEGG